MAFANPHSLSKVSYKIVDASQKETIPCSNIIRGLTDFILWLEKIFFP